jgi:hypothetical protein
MHCIGALCYVTTSTLALQIAVSFVMIIQIEVMHVAVDFTGAASSFCSEFCMCWMNVLCITSTSTHSLCVSSNSSGISSALIIYCNSSCNVRLHFSLLLYEVC